MTDEFLLFEELVSTCLGQLLPTWDPCMQAMHVVVFFVGSTARQIGVAICVSINRSLRHKFVGGQTIRKPTYYTRWHLPTSTCAYIHA